MKNVFIIVSIGILVAISLSNNLVAQNPDLVLTEAERDSILANYDQIFPLWGKEVVKRGFDLPLPVGLNANYMYMDQGIDIGNLGLSSGDNPTKPVDFIKFSDGNSKVSLLNARFDLWVLPFLNLYSYVGTGVAETKVVLSEPVVFESVVSQNGSYYGVGITGAFGIAEYWLSVDANWAWADLELLKDIVRTRVLGIRVGKTFKVFKTHRVAFWVGTMNQKFETITQGSVGLAEVLPGDIMDQLNDYQNSNWYKVLPPDQKENVDQIVDDINNRFDTAKINYKIDKGPSTPWNLLVGANYEFSKNWQFRVEAGLIGRWSAFANLNYRFSL